MRLLLLLLFVTTSGHAARITDARVYAEGEHVVLEMRSDVPLSRARLGKSREGAVVVLRAFDVRVKRRYLEDPGPARRVLLHRSLGARHVANLRVRLHRAPSAAAWRAAKPEVEGRRLRLRLRLGELPQAPVVVDAPVTPKTKTKTRPLL